MHLNFTLLTKSLYMFRAPTCPSSGGQTIHTPHYYYNAWSTTHKKKLYIYFSKDVRIRGYFSKLKVRGKLV